MLGRGTGGPSLSGVSSNVRVWNNVNPIGANGTAFVTASAAQTARTFERTDCNNHAVWFCDKLARTQFDSVDLTLVALGGASISMWSPSEATYPLLQESIAVWGATGQTPADVFLWHQGEADTELEVEVYADAFEAMVANLIAGGVLSDETIILLAGTAEETAARVAFNKSVLLPLAARPSRAYAHSYGLPTTDGHHFTGDGLNAFGARRYFSAYMFASRQG